MGAMSDKKAWYREPIVVVPAFGLGMGLAVVPLAIWGQNGAPAFYGSLTAALIAAGAVVGNSRLQSIEYDRQQGILKRRNAHEAAIQVLGYAKYAVVQLHLFKSAAKSAQFNGASSTISSPKDKSNTTVGQFRSMCRENETEAAEEIIGICSRMSPDISSKVAYFLYFFIIITEQVVRMPSAPVDHKVDRQTIQNLIENCDRLSLLGTNAIKLIEKFLAADGATIENFVLPTSS
jgi:hypothetical protein